MERRESACLRAWRRVAFALSRPGIMVVLAAALSYEITTLPVDPVRDGGESVIGRVIARAIAGKQQGVYTGAREIGVFLARSQESATGFEVIDPDAESTDRITRILRESPQAIAPVGVLARPIAKGLWRPTRLDYRWSLRAPREWTSDDIARATRTLANHLEAQQEPDLASLARAMTDNRLTCIRWIGYAHNTLDAAIFVGFVISCGWIMPNSGWRLRRALRRARCPSCGYSLKDLEPHSGNGPSVRCPECGSVWNTDASRDETGPDSREQCREKA